MALMKITAFDVVRCGYYKRGKHAPLFGALPDALQSLSDWVSGKEMSLTKTFESIDDNVFPVYCFDIKHSADRNNYLVATWNEVPMGEEGVSVASGLAKVGAVDVETAEVKEGGIPGFPTYFYFIADRNLLFSIRPEWQRHSGHQGWIQYMKSFLQKSSSYVVVNEDALDVDSEIIGYRKSQNHAIVNASPSYFSRLKRLPGQVEYLFANRERIRKLVRIDTLSLLIQKDRHLIGKILENMGWLDRQINDEKMKFRYELEFQPSEEELEQAVEHAVDPQRASRAGFVLTGSSDIYWLDHAYAKDDLFVNVNPDKNGVISSLDLLMELGKMHEQLEGIAAG